MCNWLNFPSSDENNLLSDCSLNLALTNISKAQFIKERIVYLTFMLAGQFGKGYTYRGIYSLLPIKGEGRQN